MADVPVNPAPRIHRRKRRPITPRLLGREEAAAFCGIGESTWDRHTAAGLTPAPFKLGGAVVWSRAELAAWIKHRCPPRVEWVPVWAAILARRAK